MKITKEIKIALVAICGLVIMFIGMNFLKGLNLFSSTSTYFISFDDISGLSSSAPIYADGYKVGAVSDIQYDYDKSGNIIIKAEIDKQLRIPQGSSAEIVSDMLGNVKVNLLLANNPRERVAIGGMINGNIKNGAMGQLQDMVPTVMAILPKLDSIAASLNVLLADPALANSLHNVETVTGNLTVTTTQLNTLLTNLNHDVPGMMKKAGNVLDNTTTLTANLSKVDVAGTMAKVDATLQNVEEFTAQLNDREGSLGLLMHDPALYNNMNSTLRSADSLLIDLKAHPKRYVHFSLFGRKDK